MFAYLMAFHVRSLNGRMGPSDDPAMAHGGYVDYPEDKYG
jgi:hypothetical protein